MAKPTKTAPKRTNKSKTKKGKLDFLTNRINFKSRKTQFILTILVFALVGGAWFTYKSFAATETTYSNGAIHDGWKYSYASFTSPPKAEENLYISSKLQAQGRKALPLAKVPGSTRLLSKLANKVKMNISQVEILAGCFFLFSDSLKNFPKSHCKTIHPIQRQLPS